MEKESKAERPRKSEGSEHRNQTAYVADSIQQESDTGKADSTVFGGFVPPTRNWFPMPNEWTDITAEIDSLAELKVVEYVLRHTWGYHEYGITKTISTDEFMYGRRRHDGSRMDKGTKLSKQSVIDGVKKALRDGYLICEIDTTDQARVEKSYALKMSPFTSIEPLPSPDVKEVGGVKNLDRVEGGLVSRQQMSSILTADVKEVDIRGTESRHRSEKDTLERHSRKTPKKDSGDGTTHIAQNVETFFLENVAEPAPLERVSPLAAPATRMKPARKKPDLFEQASPEIQTIISEWQSIFKATIPVTAKLIEHATTLSVWNPVPGEIAACRLWMYKSDTKGWYREHGMHLGDVARDFERFRSLADIPTMRPTQATPTTMSYKALTPMRNLQSSVGVR